MPTKRWAGHDFQRGLANMTNGPSYTLLWVVLIHPHLVPRCVRATESHSHCCCGPDLFWTAHLGTMASFFQAPKESSKCIELLLLLLLVHPRKSESNKNSTEKMKARPFPVVPANCTRVVQLTWRWVGQVLKMNEREKEKDFFILFCFSLKTQECKSNSRCC